MKKTLSLLLAVLMLCSVAVLSACKDDSSAMTDDTVINIGSQTMTFRSDNGDTFTYEYLTSTSVVITSFAGTTEPHTVEIPEAIENKRVAAIGENAFYACSSVSEIVTKAPIETIGAYAFANCEALTHMELPATVTTVADGAFYGCDMLSAVTINEGVESIGARAFADCLALESITISSTVKTIGEAAFLDCTALKAIALPEGVESVGNQAFYGCTGVESLTLPASLTEIGDWAFNPMARDLAEEAISAPADSAAAAYIHEQRTATID